MTAAARVGLTETSTESGSPRLNRAAARFIKIAPSAVDFDVRGFSPCAPAVRQALELHGLNFAAGFNTAIATPVPALARRLDEIPSAERGFAFEGAAMALGLLDLLLPTRTRRITAFLHAGGAPHVYMVHVGAGWALARLRLRPWGRLSLDPLLRWLALDGYGFHQAFFRPARYVNRAKRATRLRGYELRVFDQGVGRALWFVEAASPDRIAHAIGRFAPSRHADLWSGVGLAATYAGASTTEELEQLRTLASSFELHLAQGAAFAAAARARAGNIVPHTHEAVRVFCGCDVETSVAVTDRARAHAVGGTAADYERWRTAIRETLLSVLVHA